MRKESYPWLSADRGVSASIPSLSGDYGSEPDSGGRRGPFPHRATTRVRRWPTTQQIVSVVARIAGKLSHHHGHNTDELCSFVVLFSQQQNLLSERLVNEFFI